MRGRWRSLRGSGDGFTLVEMIVVLALMAILLAVSGAGVLRYRRYIQWKEQDAYARQVYLAVQSELAKRAGEGRLYPLEALFGQADILDFTGLIGPDGQPLTAGDVWRTEEGTIYVLEVPAVSWQEQVPGLDGEGRAADPRWQGTALRGRAKALWELLGPYIPDRTFLLEGSIRIELDPSAGSVYGVFYSRYWPDGFERGMDGTDGTKGDVTDRRTEALREQRIGYHGVDTLAGTVDSRAEKPQIHGLTLATAGDGGTGKGTGDGEEEGQILLHWQVEAEDVVAWKDLTYEIKIFGDFREDGSLMAEEKGPGGTVRQEICRIILDPELLGERWPMAYPGIPSRFMSLDPGGGYQVIQAVVCQGEEQRWYSFPVLLDEARCQIVLVLDQWGMADAEAEQADGEDRKADWEDGEDRKADWEDGEDRTADREDGEGRTADKAEDGTEDLLPWSSLRELVQEAGWELSQLEGISCTVVGYGDGYVDTRMKESNWMPLEFTEEEVDGLAEEGIEPEEETGGSGGVGIRPKEEENGSEEEVDGSEEEVDGPGDETDRPEGAGIRLEEEKNGSKEKVSRPEEEDDEPEEKDVGTGEKSGGPEEKGVGAGEKSDGPEEKGDGPEGGGRLEEETGGTEEKADGPEGEDDRREEGEEPEKEAHRPGEKGDDQAGPDGVPAGADGSPAGADDVEVGTDGGQAGADSDPVVGKDDPKGLDGRWVGGYGGPAGTDGRSREQDEMAVDEDERSDGIGSS